jgi:rod shape-determining protein MreC
MLNRRQRTGYLVLAVILGHVLLISAQVNARPSSNSSALETATFGVLSEAQRVITASLDNVRAVWTGYVELRAVRSENEALRHDIAGLEFELQQQRALAEETHKLQQLLELREHVEPETLSARVIAADATPWFRTLTIDRGASDGIRSDLAVIAPKGVVGRVIGLPGPRAAKVQLLIDRNAAAGALIERTRAVGVVMGSDDESTLRLEYVSNLEDVKVGDVVVTAGIDGIYPKGFVIGTVDHVELGSGLYKGIRVDPVVEFSQLEDVLVVMTDQPTVPGFTGME